MGYLIKPSLRNRLRGRPSLMPASPHVSACAPLSAHQLLLCLTAAQRKDGDHFLDSQLCLGVGRGEVGPRGTNKRDCQEPGTVRVLERSLPKKGAEGHNPRYFRHISPFLESVKAPEVLCIPQSNLALSNAHKLLEQRRLLKFPQRYNMSH